jgi:hypothetical protein
MPAISADSGGMALKRLPDNQEDREVYLKSHDAATFVKMVKEAHTNSVDTIITTLQAFESEPELLYVALDYAHENGLTVTVAAPDRPRRL